MRGVALGTLLVAAPLWAQAKPMEVDEAVRTALETSPRVKSAKAKLDSAEASTKSVRGRFLPSIHLADEQQHWDSNFLIPFPGVQLVARDINTNQFTASVGQPLLGVLYLAEDYAALDDASAASAGDVRATEASVREEVQTQFLRMFEARALSDIARSSQKELKAQVDEAESKLKAGVLTIADVLRLKVAVANAQQQEIQAQAEEQVARVTLLEAIGLPADDTSTQFAEPESLESLSDTPALAEALNRAQDHRPELEVARKQASSAHYRSRATALTLLPDVSLEAAYIHVNGQIFQPKDSAFVGIKAEWALWEWGATWYQRQAAAAQAVAAEAGAEDAHRRVNTEVSSRLAQARAARNAVEVAQTAITSAQEAYRVTDALVKAGAATTTDLLDAQSALTQARLNLVRAKYEYGIVRVALARSMGA